MMVQFYQVLVTVLGEGLLLFVFIFSPAVGNHIVHNRRVIDGLWLVPGHQQSCSVHWLHFHIDRRSAAN